MINQRQLDRAAGLLANAVADGATVVAGGTANAPFFQPTVVTGVPTSSALWTEEIFAPIAPVVVVKDAEEAVALANDTGYGLVNSVVTADLFHGGEIARQLRAGMVHVNDATPQDEAAAPFGGIGQSGLGGRAGGDANLEEFTERRWLTLNPGPVHYPYDPTTTRSGSDLPRVEEAGVVVGRVHDPDLTGGEQHPLAVGQRERRAGVEVRPRPVHGERSSVAEDDGRARAGGDGVRRPAAVLLEPRGGDPGVLDDDRLAAELAALGGLPGRAVHPHQPSPRSR